MSAEASKTHLATALDLRDDSRGVRAIGNTPTMRTRALIDLIDGIPVCRIDAARSSAPVTARMSDMPEVFWVRMNNGTRALPEIEVEDYIRERWG